MKPSKAFGRYGTRPLDLHGDWYLVSFHARLIGMELISYCRDPGDLRLPVGRDWKEALCAKMAINGCDRRNAKAALDRLVEARLLRVEGGFVHISLEPSPIQSGSTPDSLEIQSGSTSDPLAIQSGSSPDPNQSQSGENIKLAPASLLASKLASKQEPSNSPADPMDREAWLGSGPVDPADEPQVVQPARRIDRERPPLPEPHPLQLAAHEREQEAKIKSIAKAKDPTGSKAAAQAAKEAWIEVCAALAPGRGFELPHLLEQAGVLGLQALEATHGYGLEAPLKSLFLCAFYSFLEEKKRRYKSVKFEWILTGDTFRNALADGQESNPDKFKVVYVQLAPAKVAAE